jgi:hypothetical protein
MSPHKAVRIEGKFAQSSMTRILMPTLLVTHTNFFQYGRHGS